MSEIITNNNNELEDFKRVDDRRKVLGWDTDTLK